MTDLPAALDRIEAEIARATDSASRDALMAVRRELIERMRR